MIQKIKNILLAVSMLLTFSLGAIPASAEINCGIPDVAANNPGICQQNKLNGNLCNGSNFNLSGSASGTDVGNCNDSGKNSISGKIKTILNIFSALIGVVAVIMIIYAGFRYVTSAGSEGGVKSAKNAIIYAVIGLVIVALAQVIVHFVISNVAS